MGVAVGRIRHLRHSFASRPLALGEGLPIIGRLLGHRRLKTTARYAHLARDSVRESAQRIATASPPISCRWFDSGGARVLRGGPGRTVPHRRISLGRPFPAPCARTAASALTTRCRAHRRPPMSPHRTHLGRSRKCPCRPHAPKARQATLVAVWPKAVRACDVCIILC